MNPSAKYPLTSQVLQDIVGQYQALLTRVDGWFAQSKATWDEQIRCSAGCSACCRGLFDISLLDAFLVQAGFMRLPLKRQVVIRARAELRLRQLQADWPELQAPYLLNHMPDKLWTEMPEDDPIPCPLLGEDGACLIYEQRPMICRTHGLPNIDDGGEIFSDLYCTLNFPDLDPLKLDALRWSFRQTYLEEFELLDRFTLQLLGNPLREADTFIPLALLIDFSALAKDPSLVR